MAKNPVPFLLALVFISSCQNKADTFEEYRDLRNKALKSQTVTDTTFLHFVFGMSKKEAILHFFDMVAAGSLRLGEHANFIYDANTGIESMSTVNCVVTPAYYRDTLYSISLQSIETNENPANESSFAASLLTIIINEKYGAPSAKFEMLGYKINAWFNNNIEIKVLEGISGAKLIYTDLIREHLKEDNERKQTESDFNKTTEEL